MPGYEYDAFISYVRERPCGPFVHKHFLPYFRFYLADALNQRSARVFVDENDIQLGQKWPQKLKMALARSKCLVGFWSAKYFQHEWCWYEANIMRHREVQYGLGVQNNYDGLIVGVRVTDGKFFPPFAKDSQMADFGNYFFDSDAFAQHPLHIDFEKAVEKLALGVADVINRAPTWSPDWETAPWTDEVIAARPKPPEPQIPQPTIA